jgi:hypothetical protein
MENHEIRRLIIERRRECGIGLCGSYEAIVRWLFREHNIIATTSWVCHVIQEGSS